LIVLSAVGAFAQGVDKGCSPTVANPCTSSSSPSGGSTSSGPSIFDILRANRNQKAAEAREKRLKEANEANERGIAAWNDLNFELAVKEFTLAHEKNPDEATIARNLEKAKAAVETDKKNQAKWAAETAELNKKSDAASKNISASMQKVAESVSSTSTQSGLEFGDPMVVDLRDKTSMKVDPDVVAAKNTDLSSPKSYEPTDPFEMFEKMGKLMYKLGWSMDELDRFGNAVLALPLEGAKTPNKIMQYIVWQRMDRREEDADLIAAANAAGGKGIPGAGMQSTNDCTLFALANAAGLPYGVVAARATKLIREGDWRRPDERENPERVFDKGLNGYEVVMLAEAFGRVEVVKSATFAEVLKERPIMVGVTLAKKENGTELNSYRHEIVLTKSFQYKGETFFEVIDSNQPPTTRHYIKKDELDQIMFENGVAFRPDEGSVVRSIK
jgi:hypothetical protein